MPPPPPRRSAKPSGPPPPPPRPPKGQRLAGIFSAPPPALTQAEQAAPVVAEPVAAPPVAEPPLAVEAPVAVAVPADPPVAEPSVAAAVSAEPSVAAAVLAEPSVAAAVLAEPSVAAAVLAEPSVAAAVLAEPAGAELTVEPSQPAFAQPAVESPAPAPEPAPVAAQQPDPALPATVTSASPPPLPLPLAPSSSRLSPLPSSLSLPPPPATLGARLVNSIPPHWIEVARRHPALWMVAAPLVLASLLILVLMIGEPAHVPDAAKPAPSAAAAPAPLDAAPVAAPVPAPATSPQPDSAALAALEAKAADSLSVAELLLLNEGRADKKRDEARTLALKLQQQSELAKDEAVQAQLLRFAGDPATADTALGAMALVRSPIGPDLLYEVWTSRSVSAATAELARALLYNRDVSQQASAALAAALALRNADSCEAVQAALPKAQSDGDRRSLAPLAKLNSRRACGAKNTGDCNPCARGPMKPIVAAVTAVKARRAPSFPAH